MYIAPHEKTACMNHSKLLTVICAITISLTNLPAQSIAIPDIIFKNDSAFYKGKPFTGYCYEYYTNGKLKYECNYANGIKHGNEISHYDNGQMRLIKNFTQGLPDGDCSYKYYSVDGQLRSELDYEMGEKTGQIIYPEIFYYPVIVGEKNGTISKKLIQNNPNAKVQILKTYNQYFDKKGNFNSKEFSNVEFTNQMDYIEKDDPELFISYRIKGRLPFDPDRETIYYDLKYESKPNRKPELSQSMRDCFDNKLADKLTIEEVLMRKLINNENILWELPPRVLLLTE